MRCERAQEWMTARLDGELSAWQSRRLDRHLASCTACGEEQASTAQLFEAMRALPSATAVDERLLQNTMRAVRGVAEEERARRTQQSWWQRLSLVLPVISAAAVLLLAVRTVEGPSGTSGRPAATAAPGTPADVRVARRRNTNGATAVASSRRARMPQEAPPAELAADPGLFVELPILLQMEKLQHFESIQTTDVDTPAPAHGEQSNG